MKINFLKSALVLLIFTILILPTIAQECVNTAGGDASGSGGSVSYSIGQIAYTTNTGTTASVAQGVQQAFEISTVNEIKKTEDIKLLISAFPNPITDYLILEVADFSLSPLSFYLYNIEGKLLQSDIITDSETKIDMRKLIPATYFVKVIDRNNVIKTFKIIKK